MIFDTLWLTTYISTRIRGPLQAPNVVNISLMGPRGIEGTLARSMHKLAVTLEEFILN